MFIKQRLLTPGPTATAEGTRLALASAHPHHRSPAYKAVHKELSERLRWLWDTDDDVLFVTGSGTAGMEAAMRTTLRGDDVIAVVTGGKFGERWLKIAEQISDHVIEIPVEWSQSASVEDVEEILSAADRIDAIVCVASETSTGARQPIQELSELRNRIAPEALFLVDGITAVGTFDLSMRRHEIDVLASGTQKAFGLPPGGAMVGVSARAWAAADRPGCDSFYLDLRRERKQTATGQTAYTPAVGLVYALHHILGVWQQVSREALFEHAEQLAGVFRAGVEALGLDLYPQNNLSPALTAVRLPDDVAATKVSAWLRDHIAVTVSAGQDTIKDRIVRIGHIGALDVFDMLQAVAALEAGLVAQGVQVDVGAGVAAAQSVLNSYLQSSKFLAYSP